MPEPLATPSMSTVFSNFLGVSVRGHHGPRQRIAAGPGQINLLYTGLDRGHRKFHADDAGAEHQYLFGFYTQSSRGNDRHLLGVYVALLAHAGVNDGQVDHQSPDELSPSRRLVVDGYGRRHDAAPGAYPSRSTGRVGEQHSESVLPPALNPRTEVMVPPSTGVIAPGMEVFLAAGICSFTNRGNRWSVYHTGDSVPNPNPPKSTE